MKRQWVHVFLPRGGSIIGRVGEGSDLRQEIELQKGGVKFNDYNTTRSAVGLENST
jgi:hypothetical protein